MLRSLSAAIAFVMLVSTLSASSQKPSPARNLVKLIGKSRQLVEKTLGRSSHVNSQTDGGQTEMWGAYPRATSVSWNPGMQMTMLSLPGGHSWQQTLKKYGLSAAGVKAEKTEGDGGSVGYKLAGLKGIPAGWSATWSESGLEFDRE